MTCVKGVSVEKWEKVIGFYTTVLFFLANIAGGTLKTNKI